MLLLLDRSAELEQVVGDGLVCAAEDVDEGAGVGFVHDGEEGDGFAGLAGATCAADAVDVVFDCERELGEVSDEYLDEVERNLLCS